MPLNVDRQDALRVVQEELPWALQKRVNGRWETTKTDIKGRLAAYELMNKTRETDGGVWRVLPRPEADKYTEGLSTGLAMAAAAVGQVEQEVTHKKPSKPPLAPRREYIPQKEKK